MIINDKIFGTLYHECGWTNYTTINFLGNELKIDLIVEGDEAGLFDQEQYDAYTLFMQKWEQVQKSLLYHILAYYQKKRHELGYDIEPNEDYPLVETTDEVLKMINLDGIIVPYGDIFEGRDIGLSFHCTWDDENGLGVRLLDEKVAEVGYQDVVI
ncbi:DUF6985 domain-containing protein [Priestia endophytica]|uniref:DUF6985 domain-containing protein n=1 Tax=Priestia endophytica TaxID=135735 RepID=UPI00227E68D1|nr:DUF2004 domain-containing protein [Priestia endophytica]MCY8232254.1 DUF2004 domain-containing protein [Priestia endophytica]